MNKQSLRGKNTITSISCPCVNAALSTHGNRCQTAHDEDLNRLLENNEKYIFENGLLDMCPPG